MVEEAPVKAISFEKKEIGALIKSTKLQFRWKFYLDGHLTTIECLYSKLSGMRRVFRDGVTICEKQLLEGSFSHQFKMMEHSI